MMAFQASMVSGVATAAKAEMWPSISKAVATQWRSVGSKAHRQADNGTSKDLGHRSFRNGNAASVKISQVEIPQCLHSLSRSFSFSLTPSILPQLTFDARRSLSSRLVNAPSTLSSVSRHSHTSPPYARYISSSTRPRFQEPNFMLARYNNSQRRSLFGGAASRNQLAHLEETANKHPDSASSQYGFYQALIRANMPAIVVERYQMNRFASNTACEALYHRALGMEKQGEAGVMATPIGTQQLAAQSSPMTHNAKLQAIGQAVAAQTRGANITIAPGGREASGARSDPLHVIVDESLQGSIFKWVKFFLYFGLTTWMLFLVATLVIETFQSIKKVGGKHDSEAKSVHQKVRFSDVHGCDEAKEELQELVDFLKDPAKFSTLGGKLPKGVLLVGPPGTGKTLLARAVAGEAGVPFFFMSGSEFDEVFVGVGAKRVRELFTAAKSKQPAIVFIDELDAIGGKRNARDAAYAKQTLNQLLTELDGFEQNSGVIILAATNFPELLDKALTRPGRFDRNVVVGLPDVRGRIEILKHHMKNITLGTDISVEALAAGTPGFSGAELENIINQAAVHASKAKAQAVTMLDFEWAKDKVMMGAEKRSMVINQTEKEMTAYHEAGHALVLMFTANADPLHKITIMPRGQALGMTTHLPAMDKYSTSMNQYEAHIDVCLGGKVAEELVYGPDMVTSGVSQDLKQATRVAYAMVTMFGMSPALGNVDLASNHEQLSSDTKKLIESEVRRTIEEGRQRATKLLSTKRNELDLLAKALVKYETLNKEEAFKVIKGEELVGKLILPSGPLKIPDVGTVTPVGDGLPGVRPISEGSNAPVEENDEKGPSAGGALA